MAASIATPVSTTITGGQLVDAASGLDNSVQDLFLADGRIVAIGQPPSGFDAQLILDATGKIVCPGLIDLSARVREPGQEHKATIASETRAAARGGVTTLCIPPDTDPIIDTPAVAELIHQRATHAGLARVEVLGALTERLGGERLAEMGILGQAGCVGVSNGMRPIGNSEVMRRALEYAATFGLTVFLHAEDPWLAREGLVNEGSVSTRLGLPGIPETAETIIVSRDLLLVQQTGARAHFCHLSTARAVDMVREAQRHGLEVSADVTAHHLTLTEDDTSDYNSQCHVRPPLRTSTDRDRIWEGLAEGTLVAVCSDHQPHERDARLNPFSATEPGISGLETLLALTLRLVDAGVLTLAEAIARLTTGPASVLGLERGRLSVGSVADVCIFDPQITWTMQESDVVSRGHNTPFLGWRFKGRVTHTLLGGNLVFAMAD